MLANDTEIFDSDEEEDEEEEKKKTPEDRKRVFRKELSSMLYGFGDVKVSPGSWVLLTDNLWH